MSIVTTRPDEIGEVAAEAIRETVQRAIGATSVASYLEAGSPIEWSSLSAAGWDLVGVGGDEAASLRDLVEIALAWGGSLVPLPLVTSIAIRRNVSAAEGVEGPLTLSIPTATSRAGWGIVPFGRCSDISLVLDGDDGRFSRDPEGEPWDFDPALQAMRVPAVSRVPSALARDLQAMWAAEAAGVARRAVSDAIAYVSTREQFGRPIGTFQAVKHHLADAHVAVEEAETSAIWASLEPEKAGAIAAHGVSRAMRAVEIAIQVHGGLGFTWELGIHFSLRHVQSLRELIVGLGRG